MKIIGSKLLSFRLTQRLDETTAQRQQSMSFSPISLVPEIFSSIFLRNKTPTSRALSNCTKPVFSLLTIIMAQRKPVLELKRVQSALVNRGIKISKSRNIRFSNPITFGFSPRPLPPLPSRHNIFRWLYVARINEFFPFPDDVQKCAEIRVADWLLFSREISKSRNSQSETPHGSLSRFSSHRAQGSSSLCHAMLGSLRECSIA